MTLFNFYIHALFKVLLFGCFYLSFFIGICMAQQVERNDEPPQLLINFIGQDEINRWRVTNDNVMGGVSSGTMIIEAEHGIFTGDISLDNNGGFSSVFRPIDKLVSNVKKVSIKVKGDGQPYQLRLTANIDGYRVTYRHEFLTKVDTVEQLYFNLADFTATFRGRTLSNAPSITAEKVREVGFLMTKKKPGKFFLVIHHIEFE
jgi:hypothetical protein